MTCSCGNTARYIDETGALTCAICPLKSKRDSIRLMDVPALLSWARKYLAVEHATNEELRSIIGRKPT